MTDDTFEPRLAAANPIGDLSPEIHSALDALREEILTMPTPASAPVAPRRPSRRKRAFVGLGVAVVLGVGATSAAAAGGLLAHTGLFGSGGEEGSGELIDLGVADSPQAVEALGQDIPVPPGYDLAEASDDLTSEPGLMTDEGVEGYLSWNAACAWATAWLDADATGDDAAKAEAQTTLDEIPTWPALVTNNPDGGVRAMWQAIAAAARVGDATALQAAGYTVNCTDVKVGN